MIAAAHFRESMVLFFLSALKMCPVPNLNKPLLLSKFLCTEFEKYISSLTINNLAILVLWSSTEEELRNYVNYCDGYFHHGHQ